MNNTLPSLKVYFIGIGGVGMKALAQHAKLNGYDVSGSDRSFNPNISPFKELIKNNIVITPQDGSNISDKLDYVVYSTAIENNNPDLEKSFKIGLKCIHRSKFLKKLIPNNAELIAITGTAGKTTTTGLIGWIFEYAGLNPTVYNGASVINWKTHKEYGNIRNGDKNLWIIEADESDKSLLQFNPTHTILTNIGNDHLPINELRRIFKLFKKQTSGTFQEEISPSIKSMVFESNLIGNHNSENIKSAYQFCLNYGINKKIILNALKTFKGIEKRIELIGKYKGIHLYDDYAHNSMKIKATLNTFKNHKYNVYAFWRPHGFSSFNKNYEDLLKIFSDFLKNEKYSIILLPVYYAGGTTTIKKTSEEMYNKLNKNYDNFFYVSSYIELKKLILKKCKKNDVLIGMGARDPEISSFIRNLI